MRPYNFFLAAAAGMPLIAACAAQTPVQNMSGVLTNPAGMTLYTFDKDPADASKSTCNGECAAKWPPLGYMFQLTMFLWSRSAKRRIPLKSPPKPVSPIGRVVGSVGRFSAWAFS